MGISRIIRERLKPEHKFFISEMGAYGIGSIKRICDLTPPKHGILTSIGDAHFERFKNKDNVAKAKFELADAVFEADGKIVINGDMVEQKYISKYCKGHENNFHVLKTNTYSRYAIANRKVTKDGISFKFSIDSDETEITAPVYGIHQCDNIALCVTLCCKIGVPLASIVASLKSLPQTEHRLQVFKAENAATIIDDAYNSNPTGFTSALNVLSILGEEKSGKRILVTPGMVELGDIHDEEHKKIGQLAAKNADIVLAIIPDRIKSFVDEVEKSSDTQLLKFENFDDAKKWLDENATVNDVILYENDLPDLYESKITL
jgi:UDP-N-acetylmuramoyl-tripeptide--D-alanyl-D-alanine ligase